MINDHTLEAKCNFTMVNICRGVDVGTTEAPQDSEFFIFFGTEEVMFWIYPHNITSSVPKKKSEILSLLEPLF